MPRCTASVPFCSKGEGPMHSRGSGAIFRFNSFTPSRPFSFSFSLPLHSLCRSPFRFFALAPSWPSFLFLFSPLCLRPPQDAFHGLSRQLKPFAKRRGRAMERLVYFFLNSLSLRMAGEGFAFISKPSSYTVKVSPPLYCSVAVRRFSVV